MTKWHVRGHWKGGENSCNRYFRETGAGNLSKPRPHNPRDRTLMPIQFEYMWRAPEPI